ncbi:MAG TPA: DUF4097 family beta strand repeat-containing protein [Terriglobales bacterium]|nr:DUF4097 family beta strand repeat-containing protein [Terriglobales bacterium]
MLFRRLAIISTLLLTAIAVPAAAFGAVRGGFQRTLKVTGPVDLQVLTHSGDVVVRTGPAGSVTINAKIHVTTGFFFGPRVSDEQVRQVEQNPPIRQTGNLVKIDYPPVRNMAISYDITVPADTRLRGTSGSGNQEVRGLRGDVDLRAGSGDMQLDDITGAVRVETGSGNIVGNRLGGALQARAGSGDIRANLAGQGNVRVNTGSGNVEVRGINGSATVDTGSGDINADGQLRGDWAIRAGSGNVRLTLPRGASFNVEVSTGSGDINMNHPVNTAQGQAKRPRNISGKVGNGGPVLRVRTGSGDIDVY